MKEYWSEKIKYLTPYVPGEQPKGRQWIKLNTNENPYPPSPKVQQAIWELSGDRLRLYPDPNADALRGALAETYRLSLGQIFVGNGSDEVLAFCFQTFFDPGKPVLFPDITYSFYPVYAQVFGLDYRVVPLDEAFQVQPEGYCGNNGGVVLANPNAPTGIAIALEDIRTIVSHNPDVVVLVDEAYVDFGGESAVSLIPDHPNLLVVQTMSKSRSLAGLRVGYAMGQSNLIDALNHMKNSFNSYTVGHLALAGAEAALLDPGYYQKITDQIIQTRENTAAACKQMGFHVLDSATNFLFVRHNIMQAKVLLDRLRGHGILVRHFDRPRIDNYLRISVGTEAEMGALCTAMRAILGNG